MCDENEKMMPQIGATDSAPSADPTSSCERSPAASSVRGFISAKTSAAIPAACCLAWDALIQATLDPAIRRIDLIRSAHVGFIRVDIGAIVLNRDDGRFLLDIVPARRIRDIDEEGLALIALAELGLPTLYLAADDILREPRLANSRAVWSYRLQPVGITMRMRVLSILMENGPMPLSQLLSAIRADRDPGPVVLAMACSDLIQLDLIGVPLGPATMAQCRA
jgi:hypothetical protein